MSPGNAPEHERWPDNRTKTSGNVFSQATLKYKKIPTGAESNRAIKREVGLICVEASE